MSKHLIDVKEVEEKKPEEMQTFAKPASETCKLYVNSSAHTSRELLTSIHIQSHTHTQTLIIRMWHLTCDVLFSGTTTAAPSAAAAATNELELFNSIPELKALGKVFK